MNKRSTTSKTGIPLPLTCFFLLSVFVGSAGSASGQIAVNPTGLNVSTQAPTTAFLTFGNLNNQLPAEATWCGELISAAPAIGVKCNPATIFGVIPARYNRTASSGVKAYTDIMTLPASVARRAYQAAASGATSSFFFVRRFVSTVGGPDEFVVVTCRMSGGSAGSPFSLTNVTLSFSDIEKPILFVREGETLPQIKAEITYTGTGRLQGRWEVVQPGEELPESSDLLTEATLPIEKRGTQRRYTQLSRFNTFLPPNGKHTLIGPKSQDLPQLVAGEYLILLRIEASDDDVTGSNLDAVGAGPGIVNSAAIAGFPLPVLRYFVGPAGDTMVHIAQLAPAENKTFADKELIEFVWLGVDKAAFYQVEVTDIDGHTLVTAVLPARVETYRAPSWLGERAGEKTVRWTVRALDENGQHIGGSPQRSFSFARTEKP
nr:C602 [uncultured bacterium]